MDHNSRNKQNHIYCFCWCCTSYQLGFVKHKVFTTTIVFLQQSVVCCAICGLKLCKTCSGTRWLMCSKWVASINDLVERKHTNPIVAHVSGSVNTWCSKHPNASHQDSTHTGWNSFLQLKCTFQYIYII